MIYSENRLPLFRIMRKRPRPRKPGLELSERGESPLARAAVERRQASASASTRRRAKRMVCAHRAGPFAGRGHQWIAPVGVSLPIFLPLLRQGGERDENGNQTKLGREARRETELVFASS